MTESRKVSRIKPLLIVGGLLFLAFNTAGVWYAISTISSMQKTTLCGKSLGKASFSINERGTYVIRCITRGILIDETNLAVRHANGAPVHLEASHTHETESSQDGKSEAVASFIVEEPGVFTIEAVGLPKTVDVTLEKSAAHALLLAWGLCVTGWIAGGGMILVGSRRSRKRLL